MNIEVEISLGELVDKLTILQIKKEKINDEQKLKHITKEEQVLSSKLQSLALDGVESFIAELKKVNLELWNIEDLIREKERASSFDEEFIRLARAVYVTNDKRFDVKNRLNEAFGSGLREVKSYEEY